MNRQLLFFLSLAGTIASQKINWTVPCSTNVLSYNATVPVVCGILKVPLDYTDTTSNQTLDLELLKIPAGNGSSASSKGSILFNFGGPGEDGLSFMIPEAPTLQLLTGGDRELILPNPRGVGNTLPISCTTNDAAEILVASWTTGIDVNGSDAALGQAWAQAQLFANKCASYANNTAVAELVSTAFLARDLMNVVDALREDGLVHFWGFSYGTSVGHMLAALFPDRIGSLVLDGNADPLEYFENATAIHRYGNVDYGFSALVAACIDSPSECPLAQNRTAPELEQLLYGFFDHVKYHPIPISFDDGTGSLINDNFLKEQVLQSVADPTTWPALTHMLDGLLQGNTSLVKQSSLAPYTNDNGFAIACSDSNFRTSDQDDLSSAIAQTLASSRIAGGFIDDTYLCARWPFRSKESFIFPTANNAITIKNPALLISNTVDPYTPLYGGQVANAIINGSVLLHHDGIGHVALLSQASMCTAKAIRAYWVNGTVPEPGTVCKVDVPLWSTDNGWTKVLAELASEVVSS